MIKQGAVYSLNSYDKIIVYGAGVHGSIFLRRLNDAGIDKKKVTVWDINYKEIGERFGFEVTKPDFSPIDNSNGIIVVAAFSSALNAPLIAQITERFHNAGYKTVVTEDDIMLKVDELKLDSFENRTHYDCMYQEDVSFDNMMPPVKQIAFYLPQFHEIPENDEWWGKGFTEWTNTKKAKPNFKGHYQPREPHSDFGYYDLSDIESIRKQAELAKRHGIYGWSIYYYWFSGKTLLTKPIDLLLENRDIDINFCLFWCNERWTKKWIGDHQTLLLKNEYIDADPENFIDDLKKYMEDERYIKIDGKPLLSVLNIKDIPDVREVVSRWRKRAEEIGIGEIAVFSAIYPMSIKDLGLSDAFDGEFEFAPMQKYSSEAVRLIDASGTPCSAYLRYYENVIENYKQNIQNGRHTEYLSSFCGFDNTARFAKLSNIFDLGFSFEMFYKLVKYINEAAAKRGQEFAFVFAWNEWAEAAYLEPDKRFGYAMINTFSRAIFGLPFESGEK